jgi:hypothetical protein
MTPRPPGQKGGRGREGGRGERRDEAGRSVETPAEGSEAVEKAE